MLLKDYFQTVDAATQYNVSDIDSSSPGQIPASQDERPYLRTVDAATQYDVSDIDLASPGCLTHSRNEQSYQSTARPSGTEGYTMMPSPETTNRMCSDFAVANFATSTPLFKQASIPRDSESNEWVSDEGTDSNMCWEMSIDESFRPNDTYHTTSMSDIGTAESSRSPQEDRKFIIFEQCLDRLFKRCMGCGSLVINICKSQSGSLLLSPHTALRVTNVCGYLNQR